MASTLPLDGIPNNINSYSWGVNDTFGLDNIDDLVMQSKKIMDDSDDSGNSTGRFLAFFIRK